MPGRRSAWSAWIALTSQGAAARAPPGACTTLPTSAGWSTSASTPTVRQPRSPLSTIWSVGLPPCASQTPSQRRNALTLCLGAGRCSSRSRSPRRGRPRSRGGSRGASQRTSGARWPPSSAFGRTIRGWRAAVGPRRSSLRTRLRRLTSCTRSCLGATPTRASRGWRSSCRSARRRLLPGRATSWAMAPQACGVPCPHPRLRRASRRWPAEGIRTRRRAPRRSGRTASGRRQLVSCPTSVEQEGIGIMTRIQSISMMHFQLVGFQPVATSAAG
mmetsp:Transcript_82566/g.219148  ORF Transcript_82566/g.219148 Transcript_82566/m.219148 type:complete len:273 (-) Transcript_82566:102-920(-)